MNVKNVKKENMLVKIKVNVVEGCPKNAGTYYVGVEVSTGGNYSATTEILKKDDWKFEITKATPTVDLFSFTAPKNSSAPICRLRVLGIFLHRQYQDIIHIHTTTH